MTCKDCIHYGLCLCDVHISETSGAQMQDSNIVEKECEQFKDKSRFIELPCKVGDTVYIISDGDVVEQEAIAIEYDGNFSVATMCPCYGDCDKGDPCLTYSYVCQSHYTQYNFGRALFFTREEAEKALKGREKK